MNEATNKWQMNRVGLLNFWYYQNQVFDFAGGKMLLRGTNGSGKSLTMQSLLPVLLDGVTAAARLDSFGSRSRRMEDYLLGEKGVSDRDDGIGYLYLELKRADREEYLTCGIGMSAKRGGKLTKWFFILEDNSRIGTDFFLHTEIRKEEWQPLSRRRLIHAIEGRGRVLDRQGEYKEYINDHVFGFETLEQFDELIALLINLRSPKLSKEFRPTVIYEILKNSLPQLTEDDLLPLSQTIESIDSNRERLEELVREQKDLRSITLSYQKYRDELVGQISGKWLSLSSNYNKETQLLKKDRTELKKKQARQQEIGTLIQEKRISLEVAQRTIQELSHHEGFQLVERGHELATKIEQLEMDHSQLQEQLKKKRLRVDQQQRKVAEYQSRRDQLERETVAYLSSGEQYTELLNMELLHQEMTKKMTDVFSQADFSYWQNEVKKKREHFEKVLETMKHTQLLKELYQERDKEFGALQQLIDEQHRDIRQWQDVQVREIERWKDSFDTWRKQIQMEITETKYGELLFNIDQLAEAHSKEEIVVRPLYEEYQRNVKIIGQQQLPLEHKLNELGEETAAAVSAIKRWEKEEKPLPVRSEARKINRETLRESNAVCLPFFEAVDFKKSISEPLKNKLEGALASSGILDSLISADELILSDDLKLTPNPQFFHATLADHMEVISDLPKDIEQLTADILQTILVDEDLSEGTPQIFTDGSFQMTTIKGAADPNYLASFIGAASRERYRQEQIKLLQEQIAAAEEKKELIKNQLLQLEQQRLAVETAYLEYPKGDEVYTAFDEKLKALTKLETYTHDAELKQQQVIQAKKDLSKQQIFEQELTYGDGIKPTLSAYQEALKYIADYMDDIGDAYRNYQQKYGIEQFLSETRQNLADSQEDEKHLNQELIDLSNSLSKSNELLKANLAQQKIQNVEELQRELEKYKKDERALSRTLEQLNHEDRQLIGLVSQLAQVVSDKEGIVEGLRIEEQKWHSLLKAEAGYKSEAPEFFKKYAQEKARKLDIEQLRKQEQDFDRNYTIAGDQLREYNPKIIQERSIPLNTEEEHKELETDWQMYNFQKRLVFELEEEIQTPFELQEILLEQSDRLQLYLKKEDEDLFKQIIFDSVGKVLRGLIENAFKWIEKMNRLLLDQKNSSGLSLSIRWKELQGDSAEELDTRDLLQLLRKDPVTLSEADIASIVTHFQAKISLAKDMLELEEATDDSLYNAVKNVLDYRNWFDFELKYKRANKGFQWQPLTDNRFFIFSGGEKAVAMYLPLFASVYSRYQEASENAPYIITLDEAFAGIDDLNISELFKACEELGFNYVMNSQSLYGEYSTVSQLMTYELVRPLNASVVSTVKYYWNGNKKVMILEGNEWSSV
ncbi:TIGR02680 family protein [Enterococcus sp. BWT-B8]|uniref:TIGR02680 family protein n=1 Tax=Enterococcus sp. BWT-B8 TaxID=2885157 RepID=UPI001E5225F1|nr:TIGR02680 family protein [Enterococcus sp. BWT-B8]MCB5951107.1 TIGR02680 family protein [Enterococcus sp. BWT-B8]